MEFQEVVRRRRMVRDFDDRPLEPSVVDRILANGTRAPSAGFTQGWAFLVLEGAEQTGRFWAASTPPDGNRARTRWPGVLRAPLLIVVLSEEAAYRRRYAEPDKATSGAAEGAWPVPYWHVDAGFAALLMLLTAVDAGLGACFFGIFGDRVAVFREAFAVPDDHTPVGAITVGYPAPERPSRSVARGRRPLAAVVHRGRW